METITLKAICLDDSYAGSIEGSTFIIDCFTREGYKAATRVNRIGEIAQFAYLLNLGIDQLEYRIQGKRMAILPFSYISRIP